MDLDLTGRIALVTAASVGIGYAIAQRLVIEGATAVVNARKGDRLDRAVDSLCALRPGPDAAAFAYPADLTEREQPRQIVRDVVKEHGRLDILVSNTAGPPLTPLLGAGDDAWDRAYAMLLRPAVQLSNEAAKHMAASGSGSIVFMTSSWVKQPAPGSGLSSAMRAAIAATAKVLANELVDSGVRVNQVMPGATATDRMQALAAMRAERNGTTLEHEIAEATKAVPLGRWGDPAEIADAVVFLASPRSAFTTGQTLVVDGGSVKSIF